MRLADFILANMEPILEEWEAFARQIWPGAAADPATLRNDAEDMLKAAVVDMKCVQTVAQQVDKSRGVGIASLPASVGGAQASVKHGAARVASGFDLATFIAEYRAVRASVIRLWMESGRQDDFDDLNDLTRFNESIDQALSEGVVAYTRIVDKERLAARDEQARKAEELREMNTALLSSSILQHELAEKARNSESAATESKERYRTLFDLGPVAVYACDALGVIQDFNRRATELWGRSPAVGDTSERFCGSFKMIRLDGSFISHDQCPMADVVSSKIEAVRDAELLIERPDASRITVVVNILPLKDEQTRVVGAINCFYDITERKQVEKALDLAREQAESASRAKDRFLAVLSHELRTPLTPVLMSVAAMDLNPDLAPELRSDIAMIQRNVELEARLIDDLLDLSRITSGKLRLNLEPVELNSALQHARETCRPYILEKGIHLHSDLHGQGPWVSADPARLQQVLWNLLRNAAKFTPDHGDIYLSVSQTSADRVHIQVRDTGIGIPADMLPKIFDAFEQGDPGITRQFGGMGLGLSISKALVEMHQGTITAETGGPGLGSTFTVELPVLMHHELATPYPQAPIHGESDPKLRLLVVEDHPDTAKALSRLLRVRGYSVKTANSVAAALQLAAAEPFDVMVSDIGLPDATGYDLMREIKSLYAMKGIAMSGYGMDEDLQKSREAGFSDHIVKPANVSQLDRAIRRVTAIR